MFTYRISGLGVASEIPLPGVSGVEVAHDAIDVHVRLRSVPRSLEGATETGPAWELDRRRFLLRLPGVARFLAADGTTLDMETESGVDRADALPFLLGTAFGALLLQRGGLVLHAASVSFEGYAYAFCGRSGIGKSTLIAALCQSGCGFVNDDVCAVRCDESGVPRVWPDGRLLRLFDESIISLHLGERRRDRVRSGINKHFVEPPVAPADRPIPLKAIYVLCDQRPSDPPGIAALPLIDGAQALLVQSYRPRLALAMSSGAGHVALAASVLQHARVFTLTRPRNLARLPQDVADLRAHWHRLAG